jgi:hypothetical protein
VACTPLTRHNDNCRLTPCTNTHRAVSSASVDKCDPGTRMDVAQEPIPHVSWEHLGYQLRLCVTLRPVLFVGSCRTTAVQRCQCQSQDHSPCRA